MNRYDIALKKPAPEKVPEKTLSSDDLDWPPKTVKDAVKHILMVMSRSDKLLVASKCKQDLIQYHHGWGQNIRNHMKLWDGNEALLKDAGKTRPDLLGGTRIVHPDDASMVIIEAVWEELQRAKV